MAGLETCSACGRKLAPEAVKSAGGRPLCPPCYERAKAIVEEKRRRAAEEKKAAAAKAKQEATRIRQLAAEGGGEGAPAEGAPAPGSISEPVILPPSELLPAASSRVSDAEAQGMLGSARTVCLLARIAAVLAMVVAMLSVAAFAFCWVKAPPVAGAVGYVVLAVGILLGLAVTALPAALLWFLGGWVMKLSAVLARRPNG